MKLRPSPKNEMMLPPGGSLKFALLYRHYGSKWGRGGVVVSALDFTPEGRWFEAKSLPSCCFLRQGTLSHTVSLHPGV